MNRRLLSMRHMAPLFLILLLLTGCSSDQSLNGLRRDLDRYPQYSVILQDMTSKGLIFHDYFHRYRILFPKGDGKGKQDGAAQMEQKLTSWVKVDKETYDAYKPSLGMTILSKKEDGSIETVPQPPGYQFVGDPRFGKWESDSQGNQSWKWLATAMVLLEVVDEIGDAFEKRRRPVNHGDWMEYKKHKDRGVPYFGKKDNQGKPQYGTQGSVTQKSSPSFFERQQQRMEERKTNFKDKVESRMGRTKASSGMSASRSSGGSRRR